MSVKRYDLDYYDATEDADGTFVLHSDYAALRARHNALREAVKKYLALRETKRMKCVDELSAARAEVDRLIGEGER